MEKNVGYSDKLLRATAGLVMVVLGQMLRGPLRTILMIAGIVTVYEAVIGWCGMYSLMGINTCPAEEGCPGKTIIET